ncbi:hypothetical protein OZL46_10085 [Bacillus sonorensis]|uniref:hypothetical protein n=1 Tax=Bacillus sonorensis TaxID=119858 RepID=UPI00227E44BB|nr:hypothetical protein [Bacillus sonorensis]MCY8270455.1 hypothetical protein [Bacillus sonorensis]MCY8605217.1 hypothetical protein [Bacillus sonorensis]MCZ0068780.1 hypothetical protein [Bacillus sonorensis]MCZ0095174.1 hypothetical protein [Bacillus sonorensis]MEC1518247.1 hypothetical protein [Bacillus sonorensis]
MSLKRILQMTGIFLIAAAIILSGFIINDVTYDPFMEDSMSILFFTVSTYLSTPVFCMIGGCILLGISKLIDLQEKNNVILAEKLDSIFKQGGIAAQKEAGHPAEGRDQDIDRDSFALPAADDRKYWNG